MSEITKIEKLLGEGVAANLRGLTKSELEFKLLQLANHREEIQTTQNNDEELQNTKELLKELKAPYNEQLKDLKNKSRFIHLLIKEQEVK